MNIIDKSLLNLANSLSGWGMVLFTLISVVLAGLFAALIGFEREMKGQAAGLRTHVLVSVGCSFMMTISVFLTSLATKGAADNISDSKMFNLNLDVTRIAAGILGGIGFMGAGAIIKNGLNVRGLTTATTLWCVSAIGMACGIGFVVEAFVVTIVVYLFLVGLHKAEKILDKKSPRVEITVPKTVPIFSQVRSLAEKYDLNIKNFTSKSIIKEKVLSNGDKSETINVDCTQLTIVFPLHCPKSTLFEFIESIRVLPYVEDVELVSNKDNNKKEI